MRFILALIGVVILAQQAHAIEWSGAPVACLPDRAQRWGGTHGAMQPCHCPPEEQYCPDETTEVGLEDVEVYFGYAGSGTMIKGLEMNVPDTKSLFAMTRAELAQAVRPIVLEKIGIDILNLPRCNSCGSFAISILITSMPPGFEDWLNDTLKLPMQLASRCCDGVCPAGLAPRLTKIQVPKPRGLNEGIHMPRTDIEDMTAELNSLRQDLQTRGGLNAQVSATLDLRAAVEAYLAAAVPVTELQLQALLDAQTRFNTQLDAPGVPNSIKSQHDEVLGKADALALQTTQEIDIRKRPVEMVWIDAIECSMIFTYPREGCLVQGTQITLADGSKKAIEELTLEDKVKGNHGPAKIIALSKFTQRNEEMYSINGGQAFFTIEHPVLTPGGWKSVDSTVTSIKSDAKMIGSLQVGDIILLEGNKQMKVESIEKLSAESGKSAYNLSVEGDGSFIANGFIMKGFKQMQMHY